MYTLGFLFVCRENPGAMGIACFLALECEGGYNVTAWFFAMRLRALGEVAPPLPQAA